METLQSMYERAMRLHTEASDKNNPTLLDEAQNLYTSILNATPYEDTILFQLATLFHQKGWNGLAIRIFESLIKNHGDKPEIWNNMGSCWKAENDNERARNNFMKALSIKERTDYYNNIATLYVNEGDPEEGQKYALKALELDPNNLKAHWNYSLLLLEAGDFKQGFKEYDCGIMSNDRPNKYYSENPTLVPYYFGADGQDLDGKTIIIYGEQGLGDEIMFASALQEFIDTHPTTTVIYDCHDRLEGCMKRNFPDIEVHGSRKDILSVPEWLDGRVPDYRMAIGSLFRHVHPDGKFKRDVYLKPDEKLVEHYKAELEKLGEPPYIGFGWAGGAKKTHGHARSFKLTPLQPIMKMDGTFVSLQYTGEANEKLQRHYENTGIRIHHWPDVVQSWLDEPACTAKSPGYDYDHTLALLAALDLAILPNTTGVHAAGAIGTSCWTLTPDKSAWRYRNGGHHMIMYGDWVTLFREDGDWDKTIEFLVNAYKDKRHGIKNMRITFDMIEQAKKARDK